MAISCWHCGNRSQAVGFCLICGRDLQHPAHAPTDDEIRDAKRWKIKLPTFASSSRTHVPAFLDD